MPNKSTRNSKNFASANFEVELPLSTLVAGVVLKAAAVLLEEDMFIISLDIKEASISGLTVGEVPIEFGFCDGDYSVTEVGECLTARAAEGFQRNDRIELEQLRRAIRTVGSWSPEGASEDWVEGRESPARVPLRISLNKAKGDSSQNALDLWVRNQSTAAPLTTGAIVRVSGKCYARKLI